MDINKLIDRFKTAISGRLQRWVSALFGEKCEKCGSRKTFQRHSLTRGWNDLCQQAIGDDGLYCYDCSHIKWNQTLEGYGATLPDWCRTYGR